VGILLIILIIFILKKINQLTKSKRLDGSLNESNADETTNSSLNDSRQLDDEADNNEWKNSVSLQYEKINCFFLYKKYVKEIYARMKQFKDELLASCLEFLLSLPKELVVYNLDEAFESLQVYSTVLDSRY
jgi:hypothetical protein